MKNTLISKDFVWILLGIILTFLVGLNIFAPRSIPEDLAEQVDLLQAAGLPGWAEKPLEQLLANNPYDPDLHYQYINNHYNIPSHYKHPRNDSDIEAFYADLATRTEIADIGNYGLGLIYQLEEDYQKALTYYEQVKKQDLKYLNNSMGRTYLSLNDFVKAEEHFQREIALQGNVEGAVFNLSQLYLVQNRPREIQTLFENENTRPYISDDALRFSHLKSGNWPDYFRSVFIEPFKHIHIEAILNAGLICFTWFFYFRRIDIFEREPITPMVGVLLLGAFSAPVSIIIRDVLMVLEPHSFGYGWLNDLNYSVVCIGLVEEVAKFLPVLLILLLSKQVNEPVDYMLYGGLSALGFATLENSLYFAGYGTSIVFSRFLFSTVVHMALTGIACYFWAVAQYKLNNYWLALLTVPCGLIIVIWVHGLFDYFILGPFNFLSLFSYFIALFLAVIYARMLNEGLNFSPFYARAMLPSPHQLINYKLLFTASILMLLGIYLVQYFSFSSKVANFNLFYTAFTSIYPVAVIFGAFGSLTLNHRKEIPLLRGEE